MITPDQATEDYYADMLSFDEATQRWKVESPFAKRSFGIGDVVDETEHALLGGVGNPENYLALPLGFEAKTLDDAKRMALAFACAISDSDGELVAVPLEQVRQ